MEEMKPLGLNDLEKASGGNAKTIQTAMAKVHSGPGKNYSLAGKLDNGTVVNFTGTVSYNDEEGRSWYQIDSPLYGWVLGGDICV